MNKLLEIWLIELLKAIGKLFLNPLLYWTFLLVWVASSKRIHHERMNFGTKIFNRFSEFKGTWGISLIIGLVVSLLTIGVGMVFSIETILLLSGVIILLSISFRFTLLSPSYTIGITFLLLLFAPFLLEYQTYIEADLFSKVDFTTVAILLGVFLIVEALLTRRVKRNDTYPSLVRSQRGNWIGQHQFKKLHLIPFFVILPVGEITSFVAYWPYFSLGEQTYSFILVPFVIGFDYKVRGILPEIAAKKVSKGIFYLGFIVLLIAAGSIYISWLSLVAVIFAILGKEYINYLQRIEDRDRSAYYNKVAEGLKVLAVIPNTPADRLNILAGEVIVKVNDKKIYSIKEFYLALQNSGAFFKLEILDDNNEVRFVQSALYEEDHHELGIIFPQEPHRQNK